MQPLAAVAGELLPGLNAPRERRTSARNSRRAVAWREQLERIAGHALSQARTSAEQDAVEKAHAEAVAHGPDWARIRQGSDYARPVAVKDRNQLDRLLRWFARLERETYAADKAWARHEQRTIRRTIPRTARSILLALVALARKHAVVFPSIERLAAMGQMSRRTAVACLDTLESLGLVIRHRRRRRERTELGVIREVQDTSCYQLSVPDGAETDVRPKPPAKAVYQSAKDAQQSVLHRQSRKVVRVAETPRPASSGPTRGHDWRARSREALNRATKQWRDR
ncbi:MAG: helix-turn-helix domain-containing protein [Hyphomicrobiaceae bacterium]